ncbi:MAG: hypothetical protein NTX96_01570 [Candidatus Zambryskibacteria bacterium]|nr:hypothetical protein [Candidatus Zambryskibacteria bacterium]
MENEKSPISDTVAILMIFVALCLDGTQAIIGWIPIFGNVLADFISIFIFLTFFLWFKMYGINMMTPKRFGSMIGGFAVEMIPFINILPIWTGVVVYLIGTTKIKGLVSKHATLTKGVASVGGKIKSMNKTGQIPNVPFVDEEEK